MNKVTKNYFYNILYHVISLLTPLITAPYVTRVLGADLVGTSNFAFSIVYWFILVGMLGIRIYGNKEIAKCKDDREKRNKTFTEIFSLQLIWLGLITVVYYLAFSFINIDYKTVILIYGITAIATSFDISWLFVGVQDFKKITIRDLTVKAVNIAALFLFIKTVDDFILYVIFSNVFYLLSQTIMWISIKEYVSFKFKYFKFSEIKKHIKPNLLLFIPQLAISIYSMLDQTMLGILSSDISEVGYYGYAHKFVNMFLFVTTSVGTVMLPFVARLKEEKNIEEIKKYVKKSFRVILFISIPMAIGLAVVSPFVIPWFLTESFTKTGYLISLMSPVIIFISLSSVTGMQFLIPLDRTKEYTISVTISCILNFILNLILINFIDSFGAAIATLLAEALVFIIQLYFVRKDNLFNGSLKYVIRYLLFAGVMGSIILIIGLLMGVGYLTLIIQVVVGLLIYGSLIIMSKDETFKELLKFLKKSSKGEKNA